MNEGKNLDGDEPNAMCNFPDSGRPFSVKKKLIVAFVAISIAVLGMWLWDYTTKGVTWEVDMEASLKRISKVPDTKASQFATLEEYRRYVRNLSSGLRISIKGDGSATITGGWQTNARAGWRREGLFSFWLYTPVFMSAGIGHGFTRISVNTAIVKYQLGWSEDIATREYLILRRK